MGERKVLNKYFPPDFDPSLVPRRQRAKNNEMKIRMMLPFSLRCNECGEYMYRGKKFNSRKEDVPEESYLGIMVFRFYMKCLRCNAEITFKTDPRNSDYTAEHGCSRNFEPWRDKEDKEEALNAEKDKEEAEDAMKKLENVTKDSKREMDILDALDEVRMLNARNNDISADQLLADLRDRRQKDADSAAAAVAVETNEEDEAEIRNAFNRETVKRLDSPPQSDSAGQPSEAPTSQSGSAQPSAAAAFWSKRQGAAQTSTQPAKKKPRVAAVAVKAKAPAEKPESPKSDNSGGAGLGLLAGYGSSSSSEK